MVQHPQAQSSSRVACLLLGGLVLIPSDFFPVTTPSSSQHVGVVDPAGPYVSEDVTFSPPPYAFKPVYVWFRAGMRSGGVHESWPGWKRDRGDRLCLKTSIYLQNNQTTVSGSGVGRYSDLVGRKPNYPNLLGRNCQVCSTNVFF